MTVGDAVNGTSTITYSKSGTVAIRNVQGSSGAIPYGAANGSIDGFSLGGAANNSVAAAFSTNVGGISFFIASLNANETVSIEVYDGNGILYQDIRPSIVYLNSNTQAVTDPSTTASALVTTVAKSGSVGSFAPSARVDFNIPIAVFRIVVKNAATTTGCKKSQGCLQSG